MAKTEAKKGKLEEDVASQTSRIDKSNARSAKLKGNSRFWRKSLPLRCHLQVLCWAHILQHHVCQVPAAEVLGMGRLIRRSWRLSKPSRLCGRLPRGTRWTALAMGSCAPMIVQMYGLCDICRRNCMGSSVKPGNSWRGAC